MTITKFDRRRFLATTAAASAATVVAPFVRTSHAAGTLSVGFWDHWVPGANDALEESANLPAPEIIAADIAADLEAALEQFATIADDLGAGK